MKAKKEVEFGVGGRVTTQGRPLHDGDVHYLVPRKESHISELHYGALSKNGHSGEAHSVARTSKVDNTAGDFNDGANQVVAVGNGYSQKVDPQCWAPKKVSHMEPLDSGVSSKFKNRGEASTGVRSSEVINITDGSNIAAAHDVSGDEGSINGMVAETGVPIPDLVGFTPLSSNPGPPVSRDRLKVSTGHGGPSPASASPGKQGERGKRSDLQGTGEARNGYDCHPDLKATTSLEMTDAPTVKSWKNLFSLPVKTSGPLQFYRPHSADWNLVEKPPVEAVNEGIDMWKGCLVGQFLDKRLSFPVVRSLVNRLWGKKEMPNISTTENGLYYFRFRDPEARNWVMDAGPWHLAGRPFILRTWKPGMDMLDIQLSTIPIWVKFYNIPLEYWTSTSHGHIASTVGISLHMDSLTENQTKLSFARICVEVGADCEFPKSISLDKGNGKYSTIRIEYPWAPKCCSECKRFGHNLENWQVKKGPNSMNTTSNSENEAGIELLVAEKKDMQDAGVRKRVTGDTNGSVVNSSVEDMDAIIPTITYEEDVNRVAIDIGNHPKLHGNTFKCLAQSEEEETTSDPNNTSEFSDNSPILDTFKHIKRVDELDFTPVPISRKKLKKLKKWNHAITQDPVVRGYVCLPNG